MNLFFLHQLANILLQGNYLKEILANAKTKQVKVDCIKAPFESKDILKNDGFSWSAPNRFWTKLISEAELKKMEKFLSEEVYPRGQMKAKFSVIELRDRFKVI